MRKILMILLCVMLVGCAPSHIEVATWSKQNWPYRSVAHEAVFELKSECVTVQVEGVDYLAVFPEHVTADASGIHWGDGQADFGEKTSIGGASFESGNALSVIGADIPEPCSEILPRIWATVF